MNGAGAAGAVAEAGRGAGGGGAAAARTAGATGGGGAGAGPWVAAERSWTGSADGGVAGGAGAFFCFFFGRAFGSPGAVEHGADVNYAHDWSQSGDWAGWGHPEATAVTLCAEEWRYAAAQELISNGAGSCSHH